MLSRPGFIEQKCYAHLLVPFVLCVSSSRQGLRLLCLMYPLSPESHLCLGDGEWLLVVQEEEAAGRRDADGRYQA
jgi:hypothetical protein